MKKKFYTCFEDYPTDIQEEALKILEEGNPLEYFKEIISKVHTGDDEAIDLILLSIGSLFIKNSKPVHQQIKGSVGSGKTSLLQKTLKIVPERYIKRLNNVSPQSSSLTSKNLTFLGIIPLTNATILIKHSCCSF